MFRLGRGERDALAEVYDRYATLVYSIALRICGDAMTAEDASAATFLRIWRSARSYDPARGRVEVWVAAIARNAALDEIRRRRVDVPVGPAEVIEAAAPDAALRLDVARALASLGERERRVLELAYFAGSTQREIAARMGIPLGTVKTLTRRAIAALRPLLEPGG